MTKEAALARRIRLSLFGGHAPVRSPGKSVRCGDHGDRGSGGDDRRDRGGGGGDGEDRGSGGGDAAEVLGEDGQAGHAITSTERAKFSPFG